MAIQDLGPSAAASNSLVQTSTGFNHAEGQAAGVEGPKELPAQMLDHATGYLMAFGAMMAKARQAREGGSWHVRVSLAQTGRWLWNLGRVADGFKTQDLSGETAKSFAEEIPSGFGSLRVGHARGSAVENPGILGAPGNAARQPQAAMAGADLIARSGIGSDDSVAVTTRMPAEKAAKAPAICRSLGIGAP